MHAREFMLNVEWLGDRCLPVPFSTLGALAGADVATSPALVSTPASAPAPALVQGEPDLNNTTLFDPRDTALYLQPAPLFLPAEPGDAPLDPRIAPAVDGPGTFMIPSP